MVINRILHHLHALLVHGIDQAFISGIATKALVNIVEKFKIVDEGKPIEISREDIAQYIGTATESLIRTLSDFKAEKLIDIKSGKIIVTDVQKLKNLLY